MAKPLMTSMAFAMTLVLATAAARAAENNVDYLTDLEDRFVVTRHGWGELGIDRCAHAPGSTPQPLRIGETTYARGIGHHAPGEIRVELDAEYEQFDSTIGLQPLPGGAGTAVFQVFVDDEKKFDSGVMKADAAAKAVSIPVRGARELRLVTTDAGDGIVCDCANWAEARLTRAAGDAERESSGTFAAARLRGGLIVRAHPFRGPARAAERALPGHRTRGRAAR